MAASVRTTKFIRNDTKKPLTKKGRAPEGSPRTIFHDTRVATASAKARHRPRTNAVPCRDLSRAGVVGTHLDPPAKHRSARVHHRPPAAQHHSDSASVPASKPSSRGPSRSCVSAGRAQTRASSGPPARPPHAKKHRRNHARGKNTLPQSTGTARQPFTRRSRAQEPWAGTPPHQAPPRHNAP
ncbi:hypothetical protein TcCL_ESM07897 [Trypanosoma cruzi]|nr:hypothetical protein TcCL_ESM07897 [Trypanosoma cruzi]